MTAESSSDQSLNPAPSKGAAADQWRPEARRRALAGPQQEVLQSVRNRLSPASQTWEDQSLFLLQSTVQQHGGHLDTNFVQKGKRAPQIVLSCVTSCEAGILDWFLLKEPEWQGPESSDLANYEDKASRLFRNEKLILGLFISNVSFWQHVKGRRMINACSSATFFNTRNTFWVTGKRLNISHNINTDLHAHLRKEVWDTVGASPGITRWPEQHTEGQT